MTTYNNDGPVSNQAYTQNFNAPVYIGHALSAQQNRHNQTSLEAVQSQLSSFQISPPKPCWVLPLRKNRKFVGRTSQLEQLESLLEDGGQRVAVYGLGGIGKTQVALQFAYNAKEKGCSVFWVSAVSFQTVKHSYLQIATKLGIPLNDSKDLLNQVKSYLSDDDSGQWVMIIDNADDINMWLGDDPNDNESNQDEPDEYKPLLIDSIPQNSKSLIVFTTRSRKAALDLTPDHLINIQEMDFETSAQILRNGIHNEAILHDEILKQLIDQLMFLPLAIVQACVYINANDITLANYLELLDGQEDDLIDILSEDFRDEWRYRGSKNPTATTWLISFDKIRQTHGLAADYLSFMACIESKAIPLSLLPPVQSRNDFTSAIGTLKAYSFVTERIDGTSLDVHRLVHLATRNWLKKSNSFETESRRAIQRITEVFPNDDYHRALWRSYMPHARHVIQSIYFDNNEERLALLDVIGRALHHDGMAKESEKMFEHALQIAQQLLGPEHPSTLTSMNNLATTYAEQGQWDKAAELQIQVLQMRQQLLGPEHPSTLTSINNLATTYGRQGQWDKAAELQIQVLQMFQKLLGPEHPSTLTSMSNLATTYADQDQWDKAAELQIQVLQMFQKLLGPEHPSTLTSMSNLATTYARQGQWDKAAELQIQVLQMFQKLLGPEHPSTLTSMSYLALTYARKGQWDKATELQVQVLQMEQKILGPEHPSTLTSMGNLAHIYKAQNRGHDAIELMKECVQLRQLKLGVSHHLTIGSQERLDEWLSENLDELEMDQQSSGSGSSWETIG